MELQFPNSDGSIFIEGTHHGGVSEWDGVCARVWVGRCTQDWRATLKIYVCMNVHASCHVIQVAMVVFWEILRVVYSKVETCAFRGIEMCLQLWYGGWGVSAQGELHGTQSVDRRRYLRYGSAD